jgi:ribosomal protein L7/L12
MAEALVCPTCGYPLTPPDPYAVSMQCPACKNFIIIPRLAPVQDDRAQQIVALWRADKKMDAIKLYCQINPVGPAEAKAGVERLVQQAPAASQANAYPAAGVEMYSWDQPAAKTGDTAARAAAMDTVKAALERGDKIEAIKTFRQAFGGDLRTAKLAVDQLERHHFAQTGSAPAAGQPGSPASGRMIVVIAIGVMILILGLVAFALMRAF